MEAIKPQVVLVQAGSKQLETSNAVSGIQAQISEIRNMVEKLSTEFRQGRSLSKANSDIVMDPDPKAKIEQ